MKTGNALLKIFLLSIFLGVLQQACNKQTDEMETPFPDEYFSLREGKFILYSLDSVRFVNFGQDDTTIHYHARDVVTEPYTDNTGKSGWKVVRYLRDASSTNDADWREDITYLIIPGRKRVEVVENNLRYDKLVLPVKAGYNWHGNSHLPYNPFHSLFDFSNDEDMHFWDYTYEQVDAAYTVKGQSYNNTVYVSHVADSVNVPITFPQGLAYKNYSYEVYAKGIGLIEKHTEMWEYQPPAGSNPGYRTGFSVRMEIIDHN
jgi:hypothetical protein